MASSQGLKCCSFEQTGIDGKTTGATLIGTTPNNGLTFHPMFVTVKVTAATAILAVASVSVGQTGASYSDIMAIAPITGLTAANKMINFTVGLSAIDAIAANTGIYVNVTTGATATTCTLSVAVHGYYTTT